MPKAKSPFEMADIGCCVYCKSTVDLSKEHIVPLGLGGKNYLANASCGVCRDITSEFEGAVLRGELLHLRRAEGFASRRKHSEKRVFQAKVAGSSRSTLEWPHSETPYFVLMPEMTEPPGILTGQEEAGREGWRLFWSPSARAIDETNLESIDHEISLRPGAFGRTLLKIAYCHAVGEFPQQRAEAICIHAITGKEANYRRFIGSPMAPVPDMPEDHMFGLRQYQSRDLWVLSVLVRLFSGGEAPTYEAVVARSRDRFLTDLAP